MVYRSHLAMCPFQAKILYDFGDSIIRSTLACLFTSQDIP